ncbi:LysR family transcriptional regulator [Nitrospirillum amazonense]|uniref:LysR family transcriptional regulator n=1 Tax=Nitrospirillum amazonense TaxID=28077 RepID=UPI0024129891|nr:LysR family transcriptional regulator [Nitrospirillum amazonense]MDG3441936.1 LysR family transcriptional regulator [Nitrospirillum amazonense]
MIDLRGVDLNLLVSLDALLDQANVTRAAARLGISQPALSAQLARLRDLFHDPLFVPSETGRGMVPTTRALELQAPLRAALQELETVVRRPPAFDPLTATRDFAIAASDNSTVAVGLGLMERLRAVAGPGIRLSFRAPNAERVLGQMQRGEVDLLIGSQNMVQTGMTVRRLAGERYLVAQRKGHPRGAGPLDLDGYCAQEHILVSTNGGGFVGFVDEDLERLGRRRRVALSIHQFMLAVPILLATDYLCVLPSRLARRYAEKLDLFDLPLPNRRSYDFMAAWHPRHQADPGHVWLRQQVAAVAEGMGC